MTGRICAWCRGPIPTAARRDAVCCSVRCRQNAWEPVIYWGGRRDASRSTMAGEKVSRRPGERVVEDLPDASRDTGAPRPVASAGGNDASRRAAANASLVAAAD
ncbi:MAG: hypothetical protein IJO71_11710, partial [Microbacterium sp.]|uniref:hypothetical protein n=1 Tax=Microbacterium sp. TaxID=51671 RepID=UPI0025D23CAD